MVLPFSLKQNSQARSLWILNSQQFSKKLGLIKFNDKSFWLLRFYEPYICNIKPVHIMKMQKDYILCFLLQSAAQNPMQIRNNRISFPLMETEFYEFLNILKKKF